MVDGAGRLDVARWRALSAARRTNALRAWLQAALDRGAPDSLVERLSSELPAARQARWPVGPACELALYRGHLAVAAAPRMRDEAAPATLMLDLSRPGLHPLPQWRGTLEVTRAAADGVPAGLMKSARVVARRGGEQWQAQPRSTPRSLKKQYQAAGVPPSQRDGPLVYAGERLVFVPGLGLDARVRAPGRGTTLALRWHADAPAAREEPPHPGG